MLFNSLVMDHHPYVSDQEFAVEQGVFGKRLVAGAMVFSYGLGLAATNCHTCTINHTTAAIALGKAAGYQGSNQIAPGLL